MSLREELLAKAANSVGEMLTRRVAQTPDAKAFLVPDRAPGTNTWAPVTWRETERQVHELAAGLLQRGLTYEQRVAIIASTRVEWVMIDFAVACAAGATTTVYPNTQADDVGYIVGDSGSVIVVAEDATQLQKVLDNHDLDEQVHTIVVIDPAGVTTSDRVITYEALRTIGAEHLASHPGIVTDAIASTNRETMSTLIYTSGTTGRPKGCELTHGNFVELADNAAAAIPEAVHEGAKTVMFLPLAHVFARFIEVMAVGSGVTIAHTADIKQLLEDLKTFEPTFLLVVPRVFEKVYNSAQQKAEANGKGKIFDRAAKVAIAWSRADEQGKVPLGLKLQHKLFDKLVYGKLREAMGGQVKHAVSGGGPLGERLGHFFHGIGLRVLEGYGLTETTAPITVNTAKRIKIGSVGMPLPGNAVKISEDGEVLAKGVCVMRGYWNNEEKTRETFDDDGWFRTGDLGTLDEDGFLRITGRIKELIVTASGKNVSPVVLEDQVRAHPLVSQCIAVGENRPFIAALVTLDEEGMPAWLDAHGLDSTMTVEQAVDNDDVKKAIEAAINSANETVSRAEQIKEFRILRADFSESDGTLTPSLKLRRRHVLTNNEDLINEIYGGALQK